MNATPVTVCIITKDEEENLPRCLASVPFADEVLVLDCGSTDQTVALAEAAGARVVVEEWRGHVRQKQRCVELATHRWILALDADEELSDELIQQVKATLASPPDGVTAFELPRKTYYLGGFVEHSGWWPEWRVRLFDREAASWTGTDPHDKVEVREGATRRLAGPLHHYNYRDLRHHLEKVNSYTTIMAREAAQAGRRFRTRDALFRPPARVLKLWLLRGGWRDGWRGLIIGLVAGFYVFLKYAKLWELERVEARRASGETR